MATTFPNQIQTFPVMQDLTAEDGLLVSQYQTAMQMGNLPLAQQILSQIYNSQSKIVTADYLNLLNDTVVAVQTYFKARYSPAYVVSSTQPDAQSVGDFWFKVTSEVSQ